MKVRKFNVLDIKLPPKACARKGIWKDQVLNMTVGQALECDSPIELSCARAAIIASWGPGWCTTRKLKTGKFAAFILDPTGKTEKGSSYIDVKKARHIEKRKPAKSRPSAAK